MHRSVILRLTVVTATAALTSAIGASAAVAVPPVNAGPSEKRIEDSRDSPSNLFNIWGNGTPYGRKL